jgi:hypothetical protein
VHIYQAQVICFLFRYSSPFWGPFPLHKLHHLSYF